MPKDVACSDEQAFKKDKKGGFKPVMKESSDKGAGKEKTGDFEEKWTFKGCKNVPKVYVPKTNGIDSDYGNHFLDLIWLPLYKEMFSSFNTMMTVMLHINPPRSSAWDIIIEEASLADGSISYNQFLPFVKDNFWPYELPTEETKADPKQNEVL